MIKKVGIFSVWCCMFVPIIAGVDLTFNLNESIGFGTYPLKGATCEAALEKAIAEGYRVIDTATFYRNLDAIGRVLKKYDREKFYIISKVWPNAHTPEKLKQDVQATLAQLQTSYLDAYLLHWPNSKVSIHDTLCAMRESQKAGLIRDIGLSNVTVNHLKKALAVGVKIAWVQVEMNPYFYDAALLDFCKKHDIQVQAWAPLGRGKLNNDSLLAKIGKKYGKSAAQIALRWIVQHGALPLPGSKNREHMHDNRALFDFTLSQNEMELINQRARVGKRERVRKSFGLGFADEFDFSLEECWPDVKEQIG